MTKQKNTKRVVLNLTQSQAQELNKCFSELVLYDGRLLATTRQLIETISKRLDNSTKRNQVIEELRTTGPEPTKEEIKRAMGNTQ
jgi:hypothetical protein